MLRALASAGAEAKAGFRAALKEAAEPLRVRAEELAAESISNIGSRWGAMRTGVTTRYLYVAPATRRGRGSPRPNLGRLLMRDAMLPAAEETRDDVRDRFGDVIDGVAARFNAF